MNISKVSCASKTWPFVPSFRHKSFLFFQRCTKNQNHALPWLLGLVRRYAKKSHFRQRPLALGRGAPQESILIMGHNRYTSQRPHWVALMSTHMEQNNAISRLAASHGVVMEKSGDTLAAAKVFCRELEAVHQQMVTPWWPLLQLPKLPLIWVCSRAVKHHLKWTS